MRFPDLKIFLWVTIFLIIGEVGLEVRATYRGWDTPLFGSIRTESGMSDRRQGGPEYGPTPAFPFRSRVVPLERQIGNHRYWVASSSHAEDIYLSPETTFPGQLEKLLKEGGASAVVLNASRAGNDIPINVADLKRWGPQWKPDYVILYQMSLSIGAIAKARFSGHRLQAGSVPAQATKAGGPVALVNRLVEETTIYADAKGQIAARIGASRVLEHDLGVEGEQMFSAMLHEFINTVRNLGAVPVLTTFATSHGRTHLSHFPEEVALGLFKYSSFLSVQGWVASIERLNALVRRVAEKEGLAVIDIQRAVGGHPEYFRDYVHFTPQGHQIVAETMKDALVRFGRPGAASSVYAREERK